MESNVEKAYDIVDKWLNDHKEKGGSLYRIDENESIEGIALQIIHENNLVIYLKPESRNSWIVLSPEGIKVTETKGGIRKYLENKNSTSTKDALNDFKKGLFETLGNYTAKGIIAALLLLVFWLGWDKCNTQRKDNPDTSRTETQPPLAKY